MTKPGPDASPAKSFVQELQQLRRDLRATLRAYGAHLEIDLAECTAHTASLAAAGDLSREQMHEIRNLSAFVRKRKLKPEKGRRKDLRKLDAIIEELHTSLLPEKVR